MANANKQDKVLYVRLPAQAHRRLKISAAEEGSTVTSMVSRIVTRFLAERHERERRSLSR